MWALDCTSCIIHLGQVSEGPARPVEMHRLAAARREEHQGREPGDLDTGVLVLCGPVINPRC